ncbi:MAG: four-carbon acid sugar kinase family protein [Veillonellales bacterium]
MVKLAVIADDITGANDTAVQFAKHNIRSRVRIDFDQQKLLQEAADVIVVDTESRDIAPAEAYRKVKTACEALQISGVKNIYKKVDSTLRGNLGAEIEAAAMVFQPELVVIAPAFPGNHRTTVGGYHLLANLPIELTEIAHAPKSPVNESRIVELLHTQTDSKIGLISLSTVMAGAGALKQAIRHCLDRGESWIVFDAVLDEHLRLIVKTAQDYHNVLWVGSAGMAEQLPDFYQWSAEPQTAVIPGKGAVLVIAGSVSKVTQAQINAVLNLSNIQMIRMDAAKLIQNQEREIERCIKQAKVLLEQEKDVLIASAVDDYDVVDAVTAGKGLGISSTEVSEYTAAAFGTLAAGLADVQLAGMVLTGGDTAIHVCRALEAEAIEVLEQVTAGIPLCRLVGGRCNGLLVITKAGAFGNEDSFILSLQAMRKKTGVKKF